MTYTIGNKRIKIDNNLTAEERQLLVKYQKVFQLCLNEAAIKYLEELKKVITLYTDIFTIYGTLLSKVQDYDDITILTNKTKSSLLKTEQELITYMNELDRLKVNDYQSVSKSYQRIAIVASLLMPQIMECLNGIYLFFGNFENLKKLIIPILYGQSRGIQKAFDKGKKLVGTQLEFTKFLEVDDNVILNLMKIEKVTTSFEEEASVLKMSFDLFNPNISCYAKSLLGKAILKRDIPIEACGLVVRREICHQAAEQIISIPLVTEKIDRSLYKIMFYAVTFFFLFISFLVCRLIGIIKE